MGKVKRWICHLLSCRDIIAVKNKLQNVQQISALIWVEQATLLNIGIETEEQECEFLLFYALRISNKRAGGRERFLKKKNKE